MKGIMGIEVASSPSTRESAGASSDRKSVRRVSRILWRGTRNYLAGRPLVVSFEVTHSCNASCRHCDKGGLKPNESHLSPSEWGDLCRELRPALIQLSGGEPLLREDLEEIVREVRDPQGSPFIILVTNGRLLTEDKYLYFRQIGVDQVSISLDFPDERHDEFRNLPGLFKHLSRLVPRLARRGCGDIILNTAITRGNMAELVNLARLAAEWDVRISYSAYSQLRTRDPEHMPSSDEDLDLLRHGISDLVSLADGGGVVTTPPRVLRRTFDFFRRGGLPGCPAGKRFMVVEPDGKLVPCSLVPRPFTSMEMMQEEFTRGNTCQACYVSIRAFVDVGYRQILEESLRSYRRLGARMGAA